MMITPLDQAANELLEALGKKLKSRGVSLNLILECAQNMSSEAVALVFGLDNEERAMLNKAFQLKAQAAVEAIRALQQQTD